LITKIGANWEQNKKNNKTTTIIISLKTENNKFKKKVSKTISVTGRGGL
jgi:hypothetical protein